MSEHYFTASPAVEAEERAHRFTIRGVEHAVVTASGVFSADRLDKGTQVLLDHVPDPPKTGTFLNLGCGWGPITLALAGAAPGATVLATDVNERSLALTARNAAAAGLDNVRTSQAEALLAELHQTSTPVDLIWSNPPVRIGTSIGIAAITGLTFRVSHSSGWDVAAQVGLLAVVAAIAVSAAIAAVDLRLAARRRR